MLDLRRIAIHEAGHTVMAHIQGKICDGVSIISGNGACGWSRYTPRCTNDCYEIQELEKCGLIATAGFAAEMVAFKDADCRGSSQDFDEATNYSIRMYGTIDGRGTQNTKWIEKGKELLRDNWALVKLIETALTEHRELTGEQVEALFAAYKSNEHVP